MASQAELIDKQEIADFNLYQVRFAGDRFGIYEGDFPDFDAARAEQVSIPIDANAQILLHGAESQVLAQVSDAWPRYVHLTGPCTSGGPCPLMAAARSLSRR